MIRMRDARLAGFCPLGIRDWAAQHGLDFRDLVKNGIRATDLSRIDDGFAARILEMKNGR